jgi:hypothetical protein
VRQTADPVGEAVRLAFNRDPSSAERRDFLAYTNKHGIENLCRLLWNANEFLFIE